MTTAPPTPEDGAAIQEEGEGPTEDPAVPARLAGGRQPVPDDAIPFRDRIVRAWRVFRGRDVEVALSVNPDDRLRRERAAAENRWRNIYAAVLLIAMAIQVGFADWYFVQYSTINKFEIEPSIIVAFFSSVVVEVIGLVLVITKSLFPNKSTSDDS